MRLPDVGDVIHGKYRVEEILGEGGFGIVYRAVTAETGRVIALKVLKPLADAYPPHVEERFLREMRAIARLQNPHTVTLFDHGRTEHGVLFMVCEFVEGDDLSTVLDRRGHFEPSEVVHVVLQVLESLEEAHAAGVLHRDIKPDNIRVYRYLTDPLRAKVLDFGLALSYRDDEARLTAKGMVIGSPRYMAPEQLRGDELSPATDLYALGLVAYDMLLGESEVSPRPDPEAIAALDPPLRDVLRRMLEREPEARYSSAAAALQAWRKLQESLPRPLEERTTRRVAAIDGDFPSKAHTLPWRKVSPTEVTEGMDWGFIIAGVLVGLVLAFVAAQALSDSSDTEEPPAPRLPQKVVVAPTMESPTTKSSKPAPPPANGTTGCTQPAPDRTGMVEVKLLGGGLDLHKVLVYLPTSYDHSVPAPYVVALHDTVQTASDLAGASGLVAKAKEDGAVIVLPRAKRSIGPWETVTDWQSAADQVETAQSRLCLQNDEARVFGYGAGGRPAHWLACNLPGVEALATAAFRLGDQDRPCQHPQVPYLFLAPTQDGRTPAAGGVGCLGGQHAISIDDQQATFQAMYECGDQQPGRTELSDGACQSFACRAELRVCRIDAGRPMTREMRQLDPCEGEVGTFPYADVVWSFLFADR